MTISLRERGVRGVVLDIEGTTTPVSFVYDVLFPYARKRVRAFVSSRLGSPDLDESVRLLRAEWEEDVARGEDPPPDMKDLERDPTLACVVGYVLWLMKRDRKSPGLKLLQGMIWEGGYADGSLRGEVYADVPPALERWHAAGIDVAIYSSGSVLAQKLLFSTTKYGDLTRFLDAYFDTGVGGKRESDSYRRISERMGFPAPQLLFISDVAAELHAARAAGMRDVLCVRPESNEAAAGPDAIHSFDEVSA